MNEKAVIVSMARTPIGDFMGALKTKTAVELGIIAGEAAIERAGIKSTEIDEVLVGMVYKAGAKGNPARQIQIGLNIPVEVPAATVEQQCASSMRALEMAVNQIQLGQKDACLVAGIESMSQVPYLMLDGRKGFRMGDNKVRDGLLYDALICAFTDAHQGEGIEKLAAQYNITREEQDEVALLSHQRASVAMAIGKFESEIVPVEVKSRRSTVVVNEDEHPKADMSIEKLQKLRPAFLREGTVTAGNASSINDGACAVIVMSESKAKEMNLKPLAEIKSSVTVGVEPDVMGIGPVYSIPKAIELAGLSKDEIEYYEINEAFAVQFLAVQKALDLNLDQVNANGSGIALGHPVGCTGLRLVMALITELKFRDKQYGVASLCAGGGPSMATVVENIK